MIAHFWHRAARRGRGGVSALADSRLMTAAVLFAALGSVLLCTGSAAAASDWPMNAYDVQRTGYNPNETVIGTTNVSGLHELWSQNLGAVSNTQPALASNVLVNGVPTDLVYVGTEHGDFAAFDASTGHIVWQRNLGSVQTACNFMPGDVFGVTASASIDRATGRVYTVGGDGQVYALDLATGAIVSGWPVAVTADPQHEHAYGAVTIWNGTLYAVIASYCDIPPYHGKIVGIDTRAASRVSGFFPAGQNGPNGGGIWGLPGLSVDPATGDVYAATGNSLSRPEYSRYCDQVVRLSSALKVKAANYPGLTGFDVDFGATPILYQPPGCPPLLAAMNKSGVLLVYGRDHIANGPGQRLQVANVNDGNFQGIPAYSPVTNMLYVANSTDSNLGTYKHGMVAFSMKPNCALTLAWQKTVGPAQTTPSDPTVANGVVYYGDGIGNTVHAFDAANGTELWRSGPEIGGPVFAAPIVVNGRVFVAAWDQKLHAFGL